MKTRLVLAFTVGILLISCGDNIQEASIAVCEIKISRGDYGEKWPFTVDEGVLRCDNSAVSFIANGKIYGVNGLAKTRGMDKGYSEIEDIWALDPKLSDEGRIDVRIDIGPIISDGLELCNSR